MFKLTATGVSLLLLTACNVAGLATTSYSPDAFQTMNRAAFSERVQRVDGGREGQNGMRLPEGHTKFSGPKITYFWGTDGFVSARKLPDGEVLYFFNVVLQYQDDYIRRYDSVTDVSGTKMPFKTTSAREINGGYVREYIGVTLTEAQMKEAKFDGLFLTFAAKEHEKKVARNSRGQSLGIVGALRLANEARGGSNPEYKNNDNYDLEVPANYIRNFLSEVNR